MLFKFSGNIGLGLTQMLFMQVSFQWELRKRHGHTLWLLYLDMRSEDSTQRLKLSSLHI